MTALFDSAAEGPLPDALAERGRALAARATRETLSPGAIVGPYEICGVIGSGGQAVVYRAIHREIGSVVALKVPHAEVAPRLAREARILARLEHRHIVRVIDASFDGSTPWIAMEYLEGGSLADLLREADEPLALPFIEDLAMAVLAALEHAHQRGVIHRDLKPANILFTQDGEVKVVDFGIGKLSLASSEGPLVQSVAASAAEGATIFAGTPAYMAPEQEHRDASIDGRADLYALGKLLYEAFTRRSPKTVKPVSRDRDDVSEEWDELIYRLVEEDPRDRFADAREALAAIRDLLSSDRSTPVDPPDDVHHAAHLARAVDPEPISFWKPVPRKRARAVGAALTAILAVFCAVFVMSGSDIAEPPRDFWDDGVHRREAFIPVQRLAIGSVVVVGATGAVLLLRLRRSRGTARDLRSLER